MLTERPSGGDEPRRPGDDFLMLKALVLLILGGFIVDLYLSTPRLGIAVVAAITVLIMLWRLM